MTPSTRPLGESFRLTQTSDSVREVNVALPAVTTRPAKVLPFTIPAMANEPVPSGYKSIDEIVGKFESNPALQQELLDARRWIADTALAGKPVTLRTLRLRKGLSQAQLAVAIGTLQPHIARIERGQADPQLGTCRRIARALDVDLNTLDQALQADVDTGR